MLVVMHETTVWRRSAALANRILRGPVVLASAVTGAVGAKTTVVGGTVMTASWATGKVVSWTLVWLVVLCVEFDSRKFIFFLASVRLK